jgi:transposase
MARPARLKQDRTACISRIRGLLAEFGLVFAQGPSHLQAVLSETLEDATNELGTLARLTLQRAQAQWRELDAHLAWCDERIAAHGKTNDSVKTAATLLGVGTVTASAVVATVGDFKQFKSGAQFGARIGLVPRQRSSGGKNNLGGITKRGDTYLRTLLIQGAKSAVMTAHRRKDKISTWVLALRERSGWPARIQKKAVVALANKNARILWAVMTRGEAFDANHLSVKSAGLEQPRERRESDLQPTFFPARRESEDELNRSDRQRASSTNSLWRSIGSDHEIGMEPR